MNARTICEPGRNFAVAKPAPLIIDPFDDFGVVTSLVAHVDHQRFLRKLVAIVFPDLLYRRIRNDHHHDVAKFDGLSNRPDAG
ncbi:MAG TPA: hypothetical protein VLL57_11045 [Candidatus Binataceae bacterium]|nr:hypothetical protein [Candidatus Binataceae bacterium]